MKGLCRWVFRLVDISSLLRGKTRHLWAGEKPNPIPTHQSRLLSLDPSSGPGALAPEKTSLCGPGGFERLTLRSFSTIWMLIGSAKALYVTGKRNRTAK